MDNKNKSQSLYFNDLDLDHRLIEKTAGSMIQFYFKVKSDNNEDLSQKNIKNTLQSYIDFFTVYMIGYHIKKEEELLVPSLAKTGVSTTAGPVKFYLEEHLHHKGLLKKLHDLLETHPIIPEEFEKTLRVFVIDIWEHIDKEDSVLFRESLLRLKGKRTAEIDNAYLEFKKNNAGMITAIDSQKQIAEKLCSTTPAIEELPDSFRGEGCTICRYYENGCRGIEAEWWSDYQWKDVFNQED